ncbi:MAG: spondin domain-containing protein [Fimbriiglobus sp.]
MIRILLMLFVSGLVLNPLQAEMVEISITNVAPANGTHLTPVFLGAHGGGFSLFTPGMAASPGLERLAEDGGPQTMLMNALMASGGIGGTAGSGPIAPGQTVRLTLNVNPTTQNLFTFASMILPSNDAFIGNPTGIPLFTSTGQLITRQGTTALRVLGSQVWDAGTEVNDEVPMNTAFFGQSSPNTGVVENGMVALHPGFVSGGNILSTPRFADANFLAPGYEVAVIEVNAVPAPPAVFLLAFGSLGLAALRRLRGRFRTMTAPGETSPNLATI